MKLGDRMVRTDDGMRGVVAQNGPELRVVYLDRGEERIALKSEKWTLDAIQPGPLRDVEKMLIALHADRALNAYERHEPLKFWDTPRGDAEVYDIGLIEAITAYLTQRTTRPAA